MNQSIAVALQGSGREYVTDCVRPLSAGYRQCTAVL